MNIIKPKFNKIYQNKGVERANSKFYLEKSIIPKDVWKEIVLDNYEKAKESYDNKLFIINTPPSLKMIFDNIDIEMIYELGLTEYIKQNFQLFEDLKVMTVEFLLKISLVENFKIHGLYVNPSNKSTIAFNEKINKFIGLHIDNSLNRKVNEFDRPNRICFNISEESRFLIYSELKSSDLFEMAKCKNFRIVNDMDLVQFLYEYFPNHPLYKVEIKPGQAYIAPTDILIHDGSTLGNKKLDATFVVYGFFDFHKLNNKNEF